MRWSQTLQLMKTKRFFVVFLYIFFSFFYSLIVQMHTWWSLIYTFHTHANHCLRKQKWNLFCYWFDLFTVQQNKYGGCIKWWKTTDFTGSSASNWITWIYWLNWGFTRKLQRIYILGMCCMRASPLIEILPFHLYVSHAEGVRWSLLFVTQHFGTAALRARLLVHFGVGRMRARSCELH